MEQWFRRVSGAVDESSRIACLSAYNGNKSKSRGLNGLLSPLSGGAVAEARTPFPLMVQAVGGVQA